MLGLRTLRPGLQAPSAGGCESGRALLREDVPDSQLSRKWPCLCQTHILEISRAQLSRWGFVASGRKWGWGPGRAWDVGFPSLPPLRHNLSCALLVPNIVP